jgi:hypothetical protein
MMQEGEETLILVSSLVPALLAGVTVAYACMRPDCMPAPPDLLTETPEHQ